LRFFLVFLALPNISLIVLEVLVVIPGVLSTWVSQGKHEHKVITAQLDMSRRVRHHVLDLLERLFTAFVAILWRLLALTPLFAFFVLVEHVEVDVLLAVEAERNDESTSCEVVKEL